MCRDAGRSENLGGRVVLWGPKIWGEGLRPPAPSLPTSLNVWKPWQDLWSLFFNTLFNQHKVTKTIRLNLIHFPILVLSWFLAWPFSEFNASSFLFVLFCSFCLFCFEYLAYWISVDSIGGKEISEIINLRRLPNLKFVRWKIVNKQPVCLCE